MNYITRDENGVRIEGTKTIIIQKGLRFVINQIALERGSSLQGRIDYARHYLKITQVPPIYIDPEHIFVASHALRHPNCILINTNQILFFTAFYQHTMITFVDGSMLEIPLSYALFERRYLYAKNLLENFQTFVKKESVYTLVNY